MAQAYTLRKALGRKGQNGTMLNYEEGKILFGDFFERGRTGLPTSVHVEEDALDYQADAPGKESSFISSSSIVNVACISLHRWACNKSPQSHFSALCKWLPLEPSVQWRLMDPSLGCAANRMELVANGMEASQLQLVQGKILMSTLTCLCVLAPCVLVLKFLSWQKTPHRSP